MGIPKFLRFKFLNMCYILKSQETTTVVDVLSFDGNPIPMTRQIQAQCTLIAKLAAAGENFFDVVQELLNVGTPAVYGIATPVDFNGFLRLKMSTGDSCQCN